MSFESTIDPPSDISSPISILPNELLLHIFDIVYSDSNKSFKPPIALSHVSRKWRDVAINHCPLWSHLEVRRLQEANLIPLFARRSGGNRLRLFFFNGGGPSEELAWTSQNIVLKPSDMRFISDLVFGEVNSLRVFMAEKAFHQELDLQSISITCADTFSPELCLSARRVDLYDSYMKPSKDASLVFPNLTDLDIASYLVSHLRRTFSLMEAPFLQTITFYGMNPMDDIGGEEVAPTMATRFPRLRKIVFERRSPRAWTLFTRLLGDTTMFIRTLDIFADHLWFGGRHPGDVEEFLYRALQNFPSLQFLTLRMLGRAVLHVLGVLATQSTGVALVPKLTSLRVVLEPVDQSVDYEEDVIPQDAANRLPSLLEGRCSGRPLHLNDTATLDELTLPLRLIAGHQEWYRTRVAKFITEEDPS